MSQDNRRSDFVTLITANKMEKGANLSKGRMANQVKRKTKLERILLKKRSEFNLAKQEGVFHFFWRMQGKING